MRPTVHLLDPRHPFDGVTVEMPVHRKRAQVPFENKKYEPGHGIPTGQFDRHY
jgi:hypothetical protein